MRRRDHQSGFSTTVILLAVLVVAVLAVAGYVVFQHNRTKVSNAAANTNQSTSPQTTTQQPTNTQPAPTVSYLVIKEWGVKIPLPDSIKDAYYVVATNSPNTMWLGLASLDSSGCGAARGNTAGANAPIAALIRVLPTDREPVQGTLYTQLYPGVTIGTYYYAYVSGTNGKACASASTLQSIDSSFSSAVKGTVSSTAN